ncbi:MAG: pyridoxamine kinase [Eubacteriales bacterium]
MKQYTIPKKLAIINDISGFGRCSFTVALPVVSALKVQGCPVPTSIFSNHMAFPTYYMDDYTEKLPDYLNVWSELQLSFDGIYSGYLGSVEQIKIVEDFIIQQKILWNKKHTSDSTFVSSNVFQIIIDPVMGDHGKSYKSITPELCNEMKSLVKQATIITPNITEACLLTDSVYKESWSEEELCLIANKLHSLGPTKVVITGIHNDQYFVNFISENTSTPYTVSVSTPIAGESRPGTGDIFASIVAAKALKGEDFKASVESAATFISTCTKASSDLCIPVVEGVCFENFLHLLG